MSYGNIIVLACLAATAGCASGGKDRHDRPAGEGHPRVTGRPEIQPKLPRPGEEAPATQPADHNESELDVDGRRSRIRE